MIATNLAFKELNKKVLRFNNVYYAEISKDKYIIFKKTRVKEKNIRPEHKYSFYKINNKIYESFGSSVYKLWAIKNPTYYGFTKYKKKKTITVQTLF